MRTAALLAISLIAGAATTQAQTRTGTHDPKLSAESFSVEEAYAAQADPAKYIIDPDSIRIERIQEAAPEQAAGAVKPSAVEVDPAVVIDQIINIGQKVWEIVEKNKPVVNVTTTYAAAVPQGITTWDQLTGWKEPKARTYGFYAKNLYGMTVIDVKYQVEMTYGGSYKGKGRYLTGVTVAPLKVDVAWGYKFSMDAAVPSVTNVGTSDDPVAAMLANLHWQISTTLKDSQGTAVYYMQGTGAFRERERSCARRTSSASSCARPSRRFL